MSQFQVPQFLDVESKIVGPLTLKQFAFVAIPALIAFFLFFVLNTFVWVIIAFPLVLAGVLFAFVKVGGRHFYQIVFLAIKFFWQPKNYFWKRPVVQEVLSIPSATLEAKRSALSGVVSGISGGLGGLSKLWQDLTTTKNPIPKREKVVPKKSVAEIKDQYSVFRRISGEKQVARRVDYR